MKGELTKSRKGFIATKGQHQRRGYNELWLERMVGGLHTSAAEEPVPKELLDLLDRLPEARLTAYTGRPAGSHEAGDRARRRWLAKAEECRTAAEGMKDETARRTFLNLARNYERLAKLADDADYALSQRPKVG